MKLAPLPGAFRMHDGSTLAGAQIAYETWGRLDEARSNAILLFTGLSPSAHAASSELEAAPGWWEAFIGPGRAVDTSRYFLVCVNSLGSCFGSTGPASIDPASGERWRLRFPALAVEDIATSAREVLRHLGIERLSAVAGPSLGGMSALAFVALFPGLARRLICISGSDAASPTTVALRAIQREAVMADPDWRGGAYEPHAPPVVGLRIARKIGTTTYRSAQEWNLRFARRRLEPSPQRADARAETDTAASLPRSVALDRARRAHGFGPEFEVEGYLEAQATRFASVFDANCYLYLSRAMDRFQLDDHAPQRRLDRLFAASELRAALVIGVESDVLFPIAEQERVAAALEAGGVETHFARLPSIEGHDAFLVDVEAFDPVLRRFLAD